MIKVDDRTKEQKATHRWGVVARDKFLSGWGGATGGASRCAWACETHALADRMLQWVKARSEMRYVRIVSLTSYRAPRGTAHFHVYVADENHVGAQGA